MQIDEIFPGIYLVIVDVIIYFYDTNKLEDFSNRKNIFHSASWSQLSAKQKRRTWNTCFYA